MNLIPENACENGNDLCTWSMQEQTAERLEIGDKSGLERQRNALNAALLLDREFVSSLCQRGSCGAVSTAG